MALTRILSFPSHIQLLFLHTLYTLGKGVVHSLFIEASNVICGCIRHVLFFFLPNLNAKGVPSTCILWGNALF